MLVSDIIKKIPFFNGLSESDLNFITEKLRFMNYPANHTICKIDDPGDRMYIIISGKVKVCIYDGQGEEQVVAELTPGNYFGEMALLTEEPRTATVITTTASEMFILHKDQFDDIVTKFPSIQLVMGKIMSQRLRQNLAKAIEMSKSAALRNVVQKTASGTLGADKTIADVMGFCDHKALTGEIQVVNGDKKAIICYDGGQIMYVRAGLKKDDEALDEILDWDSGSFKITPKEISFAELIGEEAPKEEEHSVIIVSNSMVVRRLLEKKIHASGHQVKTAKNITAVHELLSHNHPKSIVTDIKFDDGTVKDLLENMKEHLRNSTIVILSDGNHAPEIESIKTHRKHTHIVEAHKIDEILSYLG